MKYFLCSLVLFIFRRYWIFTSDVYVYDGVKLELHEDTGCTVSFFFFILSLFALFFLLLGFTPSLDSIIYHHAVELATACRGLADVACVK